MGQTTVLIQGAFGGNEGDLRELIPRVYDRLRKIAGARLSAWDIRRLESGDLVNQTYLKLTQRIGNRELQQLQFENSGAFFGYVAVLMGNCVADALRGDGREVELDGLPARLEPAAVGPESAVLAVRELVEQRRKTHAKQGELLSLRIYGDLSVREMAAMQRMSYQECRYHLDLASDWLEEELKRVMKVG